MAGCPVLPAGRGCGTTAGVISVAATSLVGMALVVRHVAAVEDALHAEQSEAELLPTPRVLAASLAEEGSSASVFLEARLSFFDTTGSHASSSGASAATLVASVTAADGAGAASLLVSALASTRTSAASSAFSRCTESCRATTTRGGPSGSAGGDGVRIPNIFCAKVFGCSSEERREMSVPSVPLA